jgi:hypothetical protein
MYKTTGGWIHNFFSPGSKNIFFRLPLIVARRLLLSSSYSTNVSGHVHPTTLRVANENNVIMVGLPPHSTHITQPLDVTLMKPLKDYWKRMLEELPVQNPWDRYREQDVIKLLCKPCLSLGVARPDDPNKYFSPWSKAFTPSNIRSSFRRTGLWPIDFSMVKDLVYEETRGEEAPSQSDPALLSSTSSTDAAIPCTRNTESVTVMGSSERASTTDFPYLSSTVASEETAVEIRILKNMRALEEDKLYL